MRGRDPLLMALRQLTSRDRRLLELLYDHKVLTTDQIADALFPNLDTAQHRLVKLTGFDVVDRSRPLREGGGSYHYRYTIGRLGAEYVAALRGEDPPRADRLTQQRRRLLTSPTLEHTLGANGFFVALLRHARHHPESALTRWWSPEQCSRFGAFGLTVLAAVMPDGHGIWADRDRAAAFFLEHDTGSESLTRLADKLARYDEFVRRGGPPHPVLFWLHSSAREHRLHAKLSQVRPIVPVATAARDQRASNDPAGAVWSLHGGSGRRLRLAQLPAVASPAPPVHRADRAGLRG